MIATQFMLALALAAGGPHDGHDGAKVVVISQQDVAEPLDGKPARLTAVEVSWGPGGVSAPHRHPGPVYGYVLEGEFETRLGDGPLRRLKAGEAFYEPAMVLHTVSRNGSTTRPAKVVAFVLHPRDAKQIVIPEPAGK
jgi:quercetin dioxygenase-like cupin family protein